MTRAWLDDAERFHKADQDHDTRGWTPETAFCPSCGAACVVEIEQDAFETEYAVCDVCGISWLVERIDARLTPDDGQENE